MGIMKRYSNGQICRLFDTTVRAKPLSMPGFTIVRDDFIVRVEGAYNFIWSWSFDEEQAEEVVQQQASYFRQRNEALIWRVYGYDKPDNLEACLKNSGFIASPPGTFMIYPLDKVIDFDKALDIRRVHTPLELKDYLSVANIAFESDGDADYFNQLLDCPDIALFVGYDDDIPVASGRIEMIGCFGLLFAGGVLPVYRGKGFYKALVKARADLAIERNLKYLSTEAWDSSRPVLAKLGFEVVTHETTWVLACEIGLESP